MLKEMFGDEEVTRETWEPGGSNILFDGINGLIVSLNVTSWSWKILK